jgi:uncharacterized protein (DUF1501 family)
MLDTAFTRREFVTSGLTLASAAVALPQFLHSTALGLTQPQPGASAIPGVPQDHILVVVQLSGGNDGLNTVVPYSEAAYYRARPGIAIAENRAIKLSGATVGLHPALAPVADLYNEGLCSVIQGVGYPNPDRSHFKSMDIWHTADTSATGDGWLGRYFDSECCGFGKGESGTREADAKKAANPQIGIALGREAPLATKGRRASAIAFESADLFRWTGQDADKSLAEVYQAIANAGASAPTVGNSGFLTRTALDAQISSATIRRAVTATARVAYPNSDLARQLQMVASMINAGLSTRVYYVSMGGFDTHAGQGGENGRHANLLGQFSNAVRAFYNDLKTQRNDGRVLTMSFSEFGRRVGQNASQGTDHGTAAPMFLFGPMVKPGVLTAHPSMSDLDNGDLKYTVDFRSVYAGILSRWLKADANKILEGSFEVAPVLKNA